MSTEDSKTESWQDDLLPNIVDRIADERPGDTYALWPVAPYSYEAGFRALTWAEFANAVNGLAWWLVQHLGHSQNEQVLTYIGPNDMRYAALTLAAVKAGYVIFVTSPRNSLGAHRSLLEALQCRTLVISDPISPAASSIIDTVEPRTITLPSVDYLIGETHPIYNFQKTYRDSWREGFLIIHTSGSTGVPKPLVWTHETVARHLTLIASTPPEGVESVENLCRGKRVIVTLPPFHGAGISQYLFNTVALNIIPIAPAARGIVTGQGLVEALQQTPAQIALLVPSVVAEIAQDPALLEYCALHLELILYIGGDLPREIGDKVASKIPLRCQWGASEVGIPQQLLPPDLGPMDWRYIRFHPSMGAEFDMVANGMYELVIRRREDLNPTQLSFCIRGQGHLGEYRTRDYFAKHPMVSDAWCWQARADDIIVFLNGEKTNPISMEQHITATNSKVGGALVVGSQRFQAALLIEPVNPTDFETTSAQADLIKHIWPSVQEANRVAPAHARVDKTLILVTNANRPLVRAGKGTIQRAESINQYYLDIDKLYTNAETTTDLEPIGGASDSANAGTIAAAVRDSVLTVTGWPTLGDSDNFFDHGLDSLQGLRLTRALRRTLQSPDLGLSTIYQNPTIEQLTARIISSNDDAEDPDRDIMELLLSTYTALIEKIPTPPSLGGPIRRPFDVLLTGSTGTIGTYLLYAFLSRSDVSHVFCLNRAEDGGRLAQHNRFAAAGLASDYLDDGRVTFLRTDLTQPFLDLKKETYETLRNRVGLIAHVAWPVNFNLRLAAFRPQLAGIVGLCALSAAAAPRAVRLVFISSVSAVGASTRQPAPETVLESLDSPYPNGYARSKFLAERLCNAASVHLGIPIMIARVGQVAGPVRRRGLWNPAEWLPSLIISSLHLGCLPDSLGPQFSEVDWLPSDLLAEIAVDLMIAPSAKRDLTLPRTGAGGGGAEVFNLRNPCTVPWSKLLPAVLEAAQKRRAQMLEIVTPSVWLERLQVSMATAEDLAAAAVENPAIKLMGVFRHGLWGGKAAASCHMSIDRAVDASVALREVPHVGRDWIRKWVDEWTGAC